MADRGQMAGEDSELTKASDWRRLRANETNNDKDSQPMQRVDADEILIAALVGE